MPTKQIADSPPLSPALRYLLMTGQHALWRCPGWVSLAQERDVEAIAGAAWTQHEAALVAEAQAAGFSLWMQTKRRPTGDGVEQWKARFIAQHRY